MSNEIKELLITAYTSSVEANKRYWEYLTLPLDERYNLMQQYIQENCREQDNVTPTITSKYQ